MTFDELIKILTSSPSAEWHRIICWGAGTGPSYHDRFRFEEGSKTLDHEALGTVAIYKPNIAVSLGFGFTVNAKVQMRFANKFPDPHAIGDAVDVFFNNALVFRTYYVCVDGGRAYLPYPKSDTDLSVPAGYCEFIKLVDGLGSVGEYGRYFEDAGLKSTDEPWP